MNNIYLLGEIHGIRENIDVIKYLVNKLDIKHILFEVPTSLNKGNQIDQEKLLSYARTNPDGRICAEHIEYIKTLPNLHITSSGFDTLSDTDEDQERDEAMATNVLDITKNATGNILIVCGRLHAQRTEFTHEGITYQYLGYRLIQQEIPFTNIEIKYGSGTFYNFDIQNVDENKLDVPAMTLLDATGNNFDMFVYIPTAHHCTTLAKVK